MATVTKPVTTPAIDTTTGDHDLYAHVVIQPYEGHTTEAYVMGWKVEALCGKVWVPTRDPERFPVCPDCKSIHEAIT